MYLSDIKFVNLEKSKWNKETSKPDEGEYDFEEKVYVNYRTTDKSRETDCFLTWCRYDPRNNYQELREWKVMFGNRGYVPVNKDTDPYWPEPLPPDASGNYVFGDLILVKCRLIDYLQDKLERRKRDLAQTGTAKMEQLQENINREGGTLSYEMIDDLLPKA